VTLRSAVRALAILAALLYPNLRADDIQLGATFVRNGERMYIETCNIRDTSDSIRILQVGKVSWDNIAISHVIACCQDWLRDGLSRQPVSVARDKSRVLNLLDRNLKLS
jgi:hypothetical protein